MTIEEKKITLTLPESVLRRAQRAAELTFRSIDDIVASAINVALTVPSDVPHELGEELAAMRFLSDDALWAAAQPSMSPAEQERLHQLNEFGGERTLTPAEKAEQAVLLDAYGRSVLRRAEALVLLQQRGYAVSPDLPDSSTPA